RRSATPRSTARSEVSPPLRQPENRAGPDFAKIGVCPRVCPRFPEKRGLSPFLVAQAVGDLAAILGEPVPHRLLQRDVLLGGAVDADVRLPSISLLNRGSKGSSEGTAG